MPCREATKSPRWNRDGSIDRTFWVWDCLDDVEAIGLAAAKADTPYRGRTREDNPQVEPGGYNTWEIVYHYAPPVVPEFPGGTVDQDPLVNSVLEFDTTGGTAHVTQCLEQMDFGAEAGTSVKDAKVIGATGDSVEGTDVVVPRFIITLLRKPPAFAGGVEFGQYIVDLARLTGKYNEAFYTLQGKLFGTTLVSMFFDPGELKFIGATVADEGRFRYTFDASENRQNIDIGEGITIPSKRGHEYLWTMYRKKELTQPKVVIPIPHIAFVAKLPPGSADFSAELGF